MLTRIEWLACYLTTGKHLGLYTSVFTVLLLLAITAPTALLFGFAGASAARSQVFPIRLLGQAYIAVVRGVPDIVFFLFFIIALDQALEWVRHETLCPDWSENIRQGADFIVCQEAKLPQSDSPQWMHDIYSFCLAVVTFAIVFGAFASNVLLGAMLAVPHAQVETGEAYGMSRRQTFWRIIIPQMWVYAFPGLSNLWIVLIKSTPLLFLLGIEDIVYWARELGGTKLSRFSDYPHGDWRMWYFLALLVFYLAFTKISEMVLDRLMKKLTFGQATVGGAQQQEAA